jgi:hypothetical protein
MPPLPSPGTHTLPTTKQKAADSTVLSLLAHALHAARLPRLLRRHSPVPFPTLPFVAHSPTTHIMAYSEPASPHLVLSSNSSSRWAVCPARFLALMSQSLTTYTYSTFHYRLRQPRLPPARSDCKPQCTATPQSALSSSLHRLRKPRMPPSRLDCCAKVSP